MYSIKIEAIMYYIEVTINADRGYRVFNRGSVKIVASCCFT